MGTAGNTSSLLLILGLIGLLLLPSVEVSDDAVIVSWAFGLHKRAIPLHLITDVTCSLGSYTKFVCIYVSRGKVCQINLGTFKRHAILAKDIRSRLEILKKWPPSKGFQSTTHKLSLCEGLSSLQRHAVQPRVATAPDVGRKTMNTILTALILCYASSVYAADPPQTLDDGIDAFKVVAHEVGRDQPYDDPPLDCNLKNIESGFALIPTTNVGWTVNGTLSNGTVRLKWNQEHMADYERIGVRIIYEGSITGPNHVEGTHQIYGGTNLQISGTWELVKEDVQQGSPGYPPQGVGSAEP